MTKEELKYIQKGLGYTVQQMADALNVPKPTYEDWLYGKNPIPRVYQEILRGMKLAVEKQKADRVKDAIAIGLAGLGAVAVSMLLNDENEETKNTEVYDAD